MASILTSLLSLVTVLLSSIVISNGIVVLDTVDDLSGWRPQTCVYASAYTDAEFANCRVTVTGDDEFNEGYWSHCDNSACRLTYTVTDEEALVTAIRIRAYFVPNDAETSPVIRVSYRNVGDANKFEDFPVEDGWAEIGYDFEEDLIPGAIIEVRQTGFYTAGKDISMIDRIVLSEGLDEPIPTRPTVATTPPDSSTPRPTRPTPPPTTQRSTTTGPTTITTITPTTRRNTTPYTVPPPKPDEIQLDRQEMLNGWSTECEYDDDYFHLAERCGGVVAVPAIGSGYWSNCLAPSCALLFDLTPDTSRISRNTEGYGLIGIEFRSYMNTNPGSGSSPQIQIRTTNEMGMGKTYSVPSESGWKNNLITIDTLKPNSKIEVQQMSNYSNAEFVMVDKILLKFGIAEENEGEDTPTLSVLHICLIALAGALLLVLLIIIGTCIVKKMRPSYAQMDESEEGSQTGKELKSRRLVTPTHVSRIPNRGGDFNQDQQLDLRGHVDSQITIPRAQATTRFRHQ